MKRPVYAHIASLVVAIQTCKQNNNEEWEKRHTDTLKNLVNNHLPHGSGIDNGCEIDIDKSNENLIVINTDFHHMDETGTYDGWTEHVIKIKPSLLSEITIIVSGPNRNDIKDHLRDMFYNDLTREIEV